MKTAWLLAPALAIACNSPGTRVPPTEREVAVATAELSRFCTIDLSAPESWHAALTADDVSGVDCIPPAGGAVFSLGFAHAGWWLQLDIARGSIVAGTPHAFDGQAALLALDCWSWDGSVTVDADDAARWAVRVDARCQDDARLAVVGSFAGDR